MNCRACRSDRLDEVFSMDPMPLAGAFAATADEARTMPRYPLTWLLCHDCGLVNVTPDIPDEVIYSTYSYAASTVPALVRHHAEFAKVLTERYDHPRILDIGCNDGVLLAQLPDWFHKTGVDPSNVALAHQGDWSLYNKPFSGDYWPADHFDVIVSSNAFAHFSDIAGALDGVARILKPGGEFWIEVHDLDATLRTGQWDTIYHEHKVEWDAGALVRNLARVGLDVRHLWRMPLHGGLLRVRAVKEATSSWTYLDEPLDFAALRDAYRDRQPPALIAHSAAYGAAARATVYLNQMWPLPIDYVVDDSPLRAGKFVPGIGIPVLSSETFQWDRPETTLITAWNHAPDIRNRFPDYDGWVSAW